MDFGRLLEQAREFWARPAGKWIIGGVALLIVVLGVVSYWQTRPNWVEIGSFDAETAPKVAQKLTESKIEKQQQSGKTYTFSVKQQDYNAARLLLAEMGVEQSGGSWTNPDWSTNTSWMHTEADKRVLWIQQMQESLTRAVSTLSVVEKARVQITLPMKDPLFKEQETAPKASVLVQPKRGAELSPTVVRSIMQIVAGAVDKLDATSVVVMDTSKSRVVSDGVFKDEKTGGSTEQAINDQLAMFKSVQELWQQQITEKLGIVLGPGNVSVIVNPVINWQRAQSEATTYQGAGPDGQGIPVSRQDQTDSVQPAINPVGGAPGTTPNTNPGGTPTYPGQTQNTPTNQEKIQRTINYLVNQVKTITDTPGGAIEELSVGVFVNTATGQNSVIPPDTEQKVKTVVATAMGSKARVEVSGLKFTGAPIFTAEVPKPASPLIATNWMIALVALLTLLGIIGIWAWFSRRQPDPFFQPAFAGPEGALLGGIPIGNMELAAVESYVSDDSPDGMQMRIPRSANELAEMPLQEIALLGEEFLAKLGIDPAKVRMMEKVEKIAKANPEAVATLVKAWMQDM